MAAGPVSRLGSFEPGDKTGLRLSPHLAPSTPRKPVKSKLILFLTDVFLERGLLLSCKRRHALVRGEHSCSVPTACNRGVTLARS